MRRRLHGLATAGLRDYRASRRLDRDGEELGVTALDDGGDAGNGTARADASDDSVHLAFGVGPDFFGRGATMRFGIGRIIELHRHERRAADLFAKLRRALDGTAHTLGTRGQNDFSA